MFMHLAGAYYYHATEPNKNYEDTLVDVREDSIEKDLPYKLDLEALKLAHVSLIMLSEDNVFQVFSVG